MTAEAKKSYSENPAKMQHAGVEVTHDVLRWLWNEGFAAVAGDSVAWEVFPPSKPEPVLHEYLLAGWGMPMGRCLIWRAWRRCVGGRRGGLSCYKQSVPHAGWCVKPAELHGVVLVNLHESLVPYHLLFKCCLGIYSKNCSSSCSISARADVCGLWLFTMHSRRIRQASSALCRRLQFFRFEP